MWFHALSQARRSWARCLLAALLVLAVGMVGAAPGQGEPRTVEVPAKAMLLVAAEKLTDPNFARSVVLVLDYDDEGAFGLVINRRVRIPLGAIVPELDGPAEAAPGLFLGGPVGLGRVLLLIRAPEAPPEARRVFGDVYVSASMDTLERFMGGALVQAEARAYVGHAGWAAGQLDREIERGDWHVVQAGEEYVFTPDAGGLWERLMSKRRGRWVRAPRPQPSPLAASTWQLSGPSTRTVSSMEPQHTGQSS